MKKVCVVIPAYNEAQSLPRCLNSLARQTHTDFEVIVVDDGSTDNTARAAEGDLPFAVRVLKNGRRRGPAYCRNRGWRHTDANYVFFTDADCEVAPDWIAQGVRCFESSRTVGVEGRVTCSEVERDLACRAPINPFYPCRAPWESQPGRDFAASNIAYRRETLISLQGFQEGRYVQGREDSDLGWRACRLGVIEHCSAMIVAHRAQKWTSRTLRENARRYRFDVIFLKDHQFFFFMRWRILHPRLLLLTLFPPVILLLYRVRTLGAVRLLPSFYRYLLVTRLEIWREAFRQRVWVF